MATIYGNGNIRNGSQYLRLKDNDYEDYHLELKNYLTQYDVYLELRQMRADGWIARSINITFSFLSAINLDTIHLWGGRTASFSGSKLYFNCGSYLDPELGTNRTNLDMVYFTIRELTDYWWNGQWTVFRCSSPNKNASGAGYWNTDGPYDLFDISGAARKAYIDLYSSIMWMGIDSTNGSPVASALCSMSVNAQWPNRNAILSFLIANNNSVGSNGHCTLDQNDGWEVTSNSYIEKNLCIQNTAGSSGYKTASKIKYDSGKLTATFDQSMNVSISLPVEAKTVTDNSTPEFGLAYKLYCYNIHFKFNNSYQFFCKYITTRNISAVPDNGVWDSGNSYTFLNFYNTICKPLFNTTSATVTFLFGDTDGFALNWGEENTLDRMVINSDGTTRGYYYYLDYKGNRQTTEINLNSKVSNLQIIISKQLIFEN